ncbi:hypothetical protein T492DRAFT_489897 [Pavlovales sp. CCMP2436]|nr:hypothetical protein T492DRAFT_489897 [Pavlovales sp. CCMP2436]
MVHHIFNEKYIPRFIHKNKSKVKHEGQTHLRRVTRLASSSSWYPGGPISIPRLITTSLKLRNII